MARAHYYRVVQNAQGDILTGLSVLVCDAGTSDSISDTLYDAETGITEYTNPFTCDGVIDFYLSVPQRVNVEVTLPDLSVVVFAYQSIGSIQPVVLTDSGGTRWEVTVGTDGALTTTVVA